MASLRWLILTWRFTALVVLFPILALGLLTLALPSIVGQPFFALAMLWPMIALLVLGWFGSMQALYDLLALALVILLAAVMLPALGGLPRVIFWLLVPVLVLAGFVLWLVLINVLGFITTMAAQPAKTPGRTRVSRVSLRSHLDAATIATTFRIAPDTETQFAICGSATEKGWFPVEMKMPHINSQADLPNDLIPSRGKEGGETSPREIARGQLWAIVIEDSPLEQIIAFADGTGRVESKLWREVIPKNSGCKIEEHEAFDWMRPLGWLIYRLENYARWSLASRLDYLADRPLRYGGVTGRGSLLYALAALFNRSAPSPS
ncbi:MAG: hypothetical protein EA407_12220 [Rhodobacteraceae bacterium]|nr:MAG: hypothetical protein EA407_12220 [Paracoccaceae bacterium]